jgi:hypothetical protein
MTEKTLTYFKDFIEGKDVPTWKVFWKENEEAFKNSLSRNEFLTLKFKMIDHAETILKENNIEYTWTQKGKQQKQWANLHDSVCDEAGKPLLSFRRKLYDGAFGQFLNNNMEKCSTKVSKNIQKILKLKNASERAELLEDAEYNAECLWEEGYIDFGKIVLTAISTIKTDDDLLFEAIELAKKKLNTLKK